MLETKHSKVYFGSNLDVLPTLEDNSIDAIVTDPPYELGFMGKSWDSSGIAYNVELWKECLRVLKPGGHLLAFSGSRTYHRMTVAIEDAGFEVRDMIAWISNKTFPKSHNIGKAIDKAAGAKREWSYKTTTVRETANSSSHRGTHKCEACGKYSGSAEANCKCPKAPPATPEAQQWEGWGTALKPAFEPIVVARKPLIGTVAQNVLEYGTGGLNIDGSRIGAEERINQPAGNKANSDGVYKFSNEEVDAFNGAESKKVNGRWPANIMLDEYSAKILDEQSGQSKSPKTYIRKSGTLEGKRVAYTKIGETAGTESQNYGDSGGASRFFYCARASKADRSEGLETDNNHPTVKPTTLMTYLVNLVTPPNGTVLDPFTGSGSTGKAAILAGFNFVGIELTEDYYSIIEGRLKHAEAKLTEAKEKEGEALF